MHPLDAGDRAAHDGWDCQTPVSDDLSQRLPALYEVLDGRGQGVDNNVLHFFRELVGRADVCVDVSFDGEGPEGLGDLRVLVRGDELGQLIAGEHEHVELFGDDKVSPPGAFVGAAREVDEEQGRFLHVPELVALGPETAGVSVGEVALGEQGCFATLELNFSLVRATGITVAGVDANEDASLVGVFGEDHMLLFLTKNKKTYALGAFGLLPGAVRYFHFFQPAGSARFAEVEGDGLRLSGSCV